ncbi:MAG: hypothetical protein U0X39_09075 [Bacteroidales bacterium]
MDYQAILRELRPKHDFFIGIDSDGCVFDTMEVKQKEFFIPLALRKFGLIPVSKTVRETWEFVNLYSSHRGTNRFVALAKVFNLLERRPEFNASGLILPGKEELGEWLLEETKLSNENLRKYYNKKPGKGLGVILDWSEEVNREISRWFKGVAPFPAARSAISLVNSRADLIVVSQTPLEALEREWLDNGIKDLVNVIAGQEHGTKKEHLALAAVGKYRNDRILMIGDARGDMEAAIDNGVLFYPVIPGRENRSWQLFLEEGFDRFLSGKFAGSYQDSLIKEFMDSLPDTPPWEMISRNISN